MGIALQRIVCMYCHLSNVLWYRTQYFDGKISEKDLYFQCPVPKCGHLVTSDIIEKYLTEVRSRTF